MSRSHQAVHQYSIFIPCHKNTANHNTRKPLYIGRYYIQPSHHAPRSLIVLATVFSMAWYEIVIDLFSCAHREKANIPWYSTRIGKALHNYYLVDLARGKLVSRTKHPLNP